MLPERISAISRSICTTQIRVKILSNFSIFTGAKIVGLPEIIRFLWHLLTDVENNKKCICYTGDSLALK